MLPMYVFLILIPIGDQQSFALHHRTNSTILTPCLLAGFGRLDQRYANKIESILIRALCQQQV
jgi:hypothetical protein